MKIVSLQKVIRPTQLQPKLYSIIRELEKNNDYKVIVNKNNQPACVLISYELVKDMDFEDFKPLSEKELAKEMEEYYDNMPEEDKEFMNFAIDDGIN